MFQTLGIVAIDLITKTFDQITKVRMEIEEDLYPLIKLLIPLQELAIKKSARFALILIAF